jgi:hypothetical protein
MSYRRFKGYSKKEKFFKFLFYDCPDGGTETDEV